MNIDALFTLQNRWPNDTITITQSDAFYLFSQLSRGSDQPNVYQKYLQIDTADSKAIKDFAVANNMSYNPLGTDLYSVGRENVPGWLGPQTNTSKPLFAHQTTGTIHGYPATIRLAYTFAVVQKNTVGEVDLHRESVIEITLPKQFPQLVLDSNFNESVGMHSYPTSFKSGQIQELEGNFAKYFDFYAPNELQSDALTVLAPNFMQTLIDASQQFGVEFYGNKLYFITNDCIYDPVALQPAMHAIEVQLQYIDRLLKSWSYEPKQTPFDKLQTTYWQGPETKIGPWRLRGGQTTLAILAGMAFIGVIIEILNSLQ